jgi:hypothetical protein
MMLISEDGGLKMEGRSAVAGPWRTGGLGRGEVSRQIRLIQVPGISRSPACGTPRSGVSAAREKFSRNVRHFGRKALIGSGLIMKACKWRGFRGLQLFFTQFSRFFIGFSRDFHAEVWWFSRVRQNGGVFLFFYRGDADPPSLRSFRLRRGTAGQAGAPRVRRSFNHRVFADGQHR